MTYNDYDAKDAHMREYDKIAHEIGIETVLYYLKFFVSPAKIDKALETDEHMNNIPLSKWDTAATHMRHTLGRTGEKLWSLSMGVCTLKHVAKYYYF